MDIKGNKFVFLQTNSFNGKDFIREKLRSELDTQIRKNKSKNITKQNKKKLILNKIWKGQDPFVQILENIESLEVSI